MGREGIYWSDKVSPDVPMLLLLYSMKVMAYSSQFCLYGISAFLPLLLHLTPLDSNSPQQIQLTFSLKTSCCFYFYESLFCCHFLFFSCPALSEFILLECSFCIRCIQMALKRHKHFVTFRNWVK